MVDKSEQAEAPATPKVSFTKAQLLVANRYTQQQKDVLQVVLNADKTYTHEQAAAEIDKFVRKAVD